MEPIQGDENGAVQPRILRYDPLQLRAQSEPDETLVADPRAAQTPAQVVDGRLLALLGGGHPGLYAQAAGRPGAVRRQTGE